LIPVALEFRVFPATYTLFAKWTGRESMRRIVFMSLMATTGLAGCQSSGGQSSIAPPSAPAAPYRISDSDVQEAQSLHRKALKSGLVYGEAENPFATQYLDRVVANISTQRPPGSVPLRGFIVKDDDVNAFTTGTGYLYFNRGLLAALQNEAQLAMIVGHEAAHVDAGHLARSNAGETTIGTLTSLGTTLLQGTGIGGLAGTIGELGVGLASRRASAYFSHGHELEADDIGLGYAIRAGYDGQQAATTFRVLSMANGRQGRLAEFFSSHPNSEGRLRIIAAKAAATGQRGGVVGAADYARLLAALRPSR